MIYFIKNSKNSSKIVKKCFKFLLNYLCKILKKIFKFYYKSIKNH